MNKKSNEYSDRIIDNGLKKQEIERKYGAQFSENSTIPPELEGEWLNSIEKFEQQYRNAEKISLWEYVGKPPYKKLDEIPKEAISVELQRLFDLLNNNNITLDALSTVNDNELYRFITEELFLHEIDDIRVEGMMTGFIYEEFHPNSEHDIRQACDYFFRCTLGKMENIGGKGFDMLYVDTANYKDSNDIVIEKEKVVESINNFLDSFNKFEIISNDITKLSINEEQSKAKVIFSIHYKGLFDNSKEAIDYKGDGCFKLKPSEYGGWDIYHIDLPGLRI